MIEQFPNGVLKKLVVERLARLTEIAPQDLQTTTKAQTNSTQEKQWRGRQNKPTEPTIVTMSPVRRAISLLLQYPGLANEFLVLKAITPEDVRGIDLVHNLRDACLSGDGVKTASLLERYRDKSYYQTLVQLANHQHNNMEILSQEEALALINANNHNILEEFKDVALTKATAELQRLSSKSSVTSLSEGEKKRRQQLTQLIRENLK